MDGGCAPRGKPPRRHGRHPSQEGNEFGRGLRGCGIAGLQGYRVAGLRDCGATGLQDCGSPLRKFPSWEGWRVAPGWFPAPCADATLVLLKRL
ncbi:MAG: hypothetical protein LBM98_09625 [Oscillospiraceae bacterium]|nr:hypothetical protein [Oscillospiraceae bacterium]